MRFTLVQMIIITVCVFVLGSAGFYHLQQTAGTAVIGIEHDSKGRTTTFESGLPETKQFPLKKGATFEPDQTTTSSDASAEDAGGAESKINLNRASREEIMNVTGLTAEITDALVLQREEGQQFKTEKDLLAVPGITDEIVARIGPHLIFVEHAVTGDGVSTPKSMEVEATTDVQDQTTRGVSDDRININTASASELQRLPRVGVKTAEKIIAYRQANGPFSRPEQITGVRGIGPKTYEKMKNMIKVRD